MVCLLYPLVFLNLVDNDSQPLLSLISVLIFMSRILIYLIYFFRAKLLLLEAGETHIVGVAHHIMFLYYSYIHH